MPSNELTTVSLGLSVRRVAIPAPQAMFAIQYLNTTGLVLVDDAGNATPIGGTVSLTATQVAFGSGANLVTSSNKLTFDDTTGVLHVTSPLSVDILKLESTAVAAGSIVGVSFYVGGSQIGVMRARNDGPDGFGIVYGLNPSGHPENDTWSVSSQVGIYPLLVWAFDDDVHLGAQHALATNSTIGFVWEPTMGGAPVGVPLHTTSIGATCDRVATIVDTVHARHYFYIAGAWHFAAINDGAGGGGAPATATYITQVPDGGLSNEQALSTLATGLLKNTTVTGVLSIAAAGTDYQAPLTFSTGLTNAASVITADISTGKAGGQTAFGGTLTTQNLTLRPNAADATTGRVISSGLALQVPSGTSTVPSLHMGTASTGWYENTVAAWGFISGGVLDIIVGSHSVNVNSNASGAGFYVGTGAQSSWQSDGSNGMHFAAGSSFRYEMLSTGHSRWLNTPYVSYSSGAARAQADGQVMAYAITPPSQVAGAAVKLDAYKFDGVTATFTGSTGITNATGVNFIDVERPTYTDASALTITNAATFVIKGAPIAAGSVTLTNSYAMWVQQGPIRLDGFIASSEQPSIVLAAASSQAISKTGGTLTIGTTDANVLTFMTNHTTVASFDTSGHLLPNVDNTYNLGSASFEWKTVSAVSVAVNSTVYSRGSSLNLQQDSGATGACLFLDTADISVQAQHVFPTSGTAQLGKSSDPWSVLWVTTLALNGAPATMDFGSGGVTLASNTTGAVTILHQGTQARWNSDVNGVAISSNVGNSITVDALTGNMHFGTGSFGLGASLLAANNARTVTVGNVGPGASNVSIQEWFQVTGSGGAVRYIPLFA